MTMAVQLLAYIYLFTFLQTILCWKTTIKRDEPKEYVGCYRDNSNNRLFGYTPSDYIPSDISPVSCMLACGNHHSYAGIVNAAICLCSKTRPGNLLNDNKCTLACPGTVNWNQTEHQPKCGGIDTISVYDISHRIFSLELEHPKVSPVYDQAHITSTVENGKDIQFDFNTGDYHFDSQVFSYDPIVNHIYDRAGKFKIGVTAKNNISGPYSSENYITITDELSGGNMKCVNAQVFGQHIECHGSVGRGYPSDTHFNFGDGQSDSIKSNIVYDHVGAQIPYIKSQENKNRDQNFTVVLPQAEFNCDTKIYAWEVEASKIGDILLQVLKPKCSDSEIYCSNRHACFPSTTQCYDFNQWACAEGEAYCMMSQRCLPDESTSFQSCSLSRPYNFNSAPADYELVNQVKYTLSSVGHVMIKLDEPLDVNKGHVIGWSSIGGEIAYVDIAVDNIDAPEFQYSLIHHLNDDLYRPNAILMYTHHLISAHYIIEGSFYLRHNYTSPGAYVITSNITEDELIFIDIPISKLQVQCPSIMQTYVKFEITAVVPIGTNVTYDVDFDNGTVVTELSSVFRYTYGKPGVYEIKLKAYNSISHKINTCFGYVFDKVSGLEFDGSIEPVAVHGLTTIKWCADKGTNVTYEINFGDELTEKKEAIGHGGCYKTTHVYAKDGLYTVSITAINDLGIEVTSQSDALVEIPLTSINGYTNHPRLTNNIYLAINENIRVDVSVLQGTNVKYSFNFNDGSKPYVTDFPHAIHNYTTPGEYSILVTCFNKISQASSQVNATVIVEELQQITDLTIYVTGTLFGKEAVINATMGRGSLFTCEWNLGDGTVFQVDKSEFNDFITHRYMAVADYDIVLSCINPSGTVITKYTLPVEIPINGLGISCPSSRYVEIGKEINFYVVADKGSRLSYKIDFGNNEEKLFNNEKAQNNTIKVSYIYLQPGTYVVNVTAWNQIDQMSSTCQQSLITQHPIKNIDLISNSPIRFNPGLVEFYMYLLVGTQFPTDAMITWDFGDNTNLQYEPLLPVSMDRILKTYRYDNEGKYETNILIENNITKKSFVVVIDVQEIIPVQIHVKQEIAATKSLIKGVGHDYSVFELGNIIHVNITKQDKDRKYEIEFDENDERRLSSANQYQYKYLTDGYKNILVQVYNILGEFSASKTIEIQQKISDINIEIPQIIKLDHIIYINITAKSYGTRLCTMIDFGDDNTYIVNKKNCHKLTELNSKNYTFFYSGENEAVKLSYKYQTKGFTNITIEIYNLVSSYKNTTEHKVIYKPCPLPSATISGGGNESYPKVEQRSNRIILQSNVSLDCKVATNVTFLWQIFTTKNKIPLNISDNYGFRRRAMPFVRNPGGLDPTVFEIPENFLPYGEVIIELSIFYESNGENLDEITSHDSTYFDIQPSFIKASIEGGVRRAVGGDIEVVFDASKTYDPDSVKWTGEITYKWFCRRLEETFPEHFELIPPKSRDAGCFRNGRYFLTEEYGGFVKMKEDGSKIKVNTTMPLFDKFVMRVYVTKEHRYGIFDQEFLVLPGDPPSLEILCTLNCYEKLFPTDPLRIQSVCLNCKMSTVLYEWKLYERVESLNEDGDTITVEVEDVDLHLKTTTSIRNANIALKENTLDLGKNYVLRVAAWQPGATEEYRGFSDFVFSVNIPPKSGFCDVTPREGVTLTTNFLIRCGDWTDEDTPLTYKVDSLREGIKQNLYTGNEREISLILPLGPESSDYLYDLIVSIEDKYAYGAHEYFKVTVREPMNVDYNAVSNDMDSIAETGDMQALTRMALAAGSVMNKNAGEKEGNASDTRAKMIASLSKVNACTLDEIQQMGAVQMEMTKSAGEVSADAQEQSGSALDKMSECMIQADAANPGMSDTANTMLMASSNVLGASLNNDQANGTNVTEMAGKSGADKAVDTVNKVGGALMRQMVAGDKPKVVKTGSMDVEMSQVPDDADDEDTGFKLPNIQALFGNQSKTIANSGRKASVGAMVTSMKDNPFKGATGSDDIKSDVMGLAVSSPDGSPMDLSGQEMTMFVKRDLKNDAEPPVYEYDVEQGAMKVHRFNFTTEENSIVIEIRPVDEDIETTIFISHEKRTTISNSVTNYTQIPLKEAKMKKKLPDPYIQVFSASELNGTGEYYLGIKLNPGRNVVWDTYGYNPTMNYTLRTWETVCKVWDDEMKKFSSKSCKVGPKTNFNKTHCICLIGEKIDHSRERRSADGALIQKAPRKVVKRATFAGGFFVAPNPIDFSKAFAGFANLAENPVAFATVLSIFGVYLMLLFWARREDRKDIARAGVTPLKENEPFDRQFYEITVYTGFAGSAATTANVYFQLAGDEDQTEPRQFKDDNRKIFQKRGEDIFLASFPEHIGDLQYVRVWHDNTGKSPSWYLSRVLVHDLNEDRKYLFINDNTIAVEEGDGSLERLLPIAGPDEIKGFNHLFFSTTQKNLTDGHIWFSVFIRPPKSRFTRVQRLSCCLTLLYCTMVTNAMFYQVGGQSDPSTTLHLGPFSFSPSQIGIGLMTSLIIFPVNILIVGVFRSLGSKPSKEEMSKKKTKRFWWIREIFFCFCAEKKKNDFMDIIQDGEKDGRVSRATIMSEASTIDGDEIGLKMETEAQEKRREEKQKKTKKKKKKLPYWMKYFAWTLLILTSFTSAFFVILYGFQFGKEKSAQWISALFISFFQDVCVSQPIKILGLALFIALVIKKPAEEEEEDEETNKKQIDEEYLDREGADTKDRPKPKKADIIRFQPPSKEKVAALRTYRLKEIKMYNLIREIFVYCLFVMALCQVTYSFMDPRSYRMRQSLVDTFVDKAYGGEKSFHEISNVNDIWTWLNTTVLTGLYSTHWYNNEANEPGFTQDLSSNLFGGSRLRQLRIQDESCKVHDKFIGMIPDCHAFYSWGKEDIGKYDPGWKPYTNHTFEYDDKNMYSCWQYRSSEELNTYPFVGALAAYAGGGYIGNMGKSPKSSVELINNLKKNMWLDEQTRAVFLEVTVYNAQVNLFAIMNFVAELLPTNGAEVFYSIKIARLYTFGGSTESFTIACQFFVVVFFILFIYKESKKIYKERKAYFKGFWNVIEFTVIILVLATMSVFFSRMLLVSRAVKNIEDNPGGFVSFNKVVQWDTMFTALTSILVFFSCIKAIRLLQYNKTISLLACTLKGSAKPLAAFFVVFSVFFLAFTTFAYLMFVPYLADYRSFLTASQSVLSLLLGSFSYQEISETKRILGPIWFFLIMMFGVMYLMNVFLSIVMETYASVKDDLSRQSQEYEVVDFMVSKFKQVIGKGDGGKKEMLDKVAEAEEKQAQKDAAKSAKNTKQNKKIAAPQKNKSYHRLDDEIETKFAQLDDSLNGYWSSYFTEPTGETSGADNSFVNQGFEYQEIHEELEMQQDMDAELAKWI